jgi:anti-sigma B factor antagonist
MILDTKETGKFISAIITTEEANLEIADKFRQEMFDLIDNGNARIALDFSNVTYVDSSFLGALVASLKYALSKGADIVLTGLKEDIFNMLHLIRMDKVFKIYTSAEDII